MGILFIRHVHHGQHVPDDLLAPFLGIFQEFGNHADVLGHRHVGEQADLLDHVADAAAQSHLVLLCDVFSIYVDVTGVWLNETVDHFEGGGFSTARWPDQDDKFTVWDLKTQVKDHLLVAIGQRNVFKFNQ